MSARDSRAARRVAARRRHDRKAHSSESGSVEAGLCSVVLPAYNPGAAVCAVIDDLRAAFGDDPIEIIVVDDGSVDDTAMLVATHVGVQLCPAGEAMTAGDVTLVRAVRNGGKGSALALGVSVAKGQWVAFLDADGDIAPSVLVGYLDMLQRHSADVVVGSKRNQQSSNDAARVRKFLSLGYQTMSRVLLGVKCRDTQVGAKVMTREVAHLVGHCQECGYLLDAELLVVATRRGRRNIIEAPVVIHRMGATTITPLKVAVMFKDLCRLAWRARIQRVYDSY